MYSLLQVIFPNGGVHVATVHADNGDTICDDSCAYANDGQVSGSLSCL
jgi:hypothetical protein